MLPTHEKIDATIFDVEKNDGLAKQIFHAYYRTPDASGEIYRTFPEFFLIKPDVLDDSLLAFNKQELPLIANARSRATSRTGYLGVSKYFDENFAYHWIKIAAYPVVLSDLNTHQQDEFFYLLNKFVQFTQQNPNVYGDLTADAASDNAVALMLRSIAQQARAFEEKLQHYPLHMLLSFDASWPTAQVKTLLAALEINEQSWNHLFLEHLRYVMRKNKGLVKSHSSAPIVPSDVAPNPPPSAAQTAAVVVAAPLASAATDERVAPQSLDMVATLRMGAFSAPPLIPTAPTVTDKTIETVPKSRVPHAWGARLLVNAIKLMSIATLLVASALAGFLFSQSRMAKVFVPAASSGEITQAPPASVVTQSEALSEEYVLLESLRMSEHLTLPEPSKKP